MQPRRRHRGAARDVRRRRRQPGLDRRAVDGAARAGRARADPRPGQRRAGRRRGARRRAADVQPRRDLRRGRRDARRLAHDAASGSLDLGPAARVGVRPHRRGRARRWPTTPPATPTTTSRPTSTSSPTSCSPAPGWPTTRSRTGPGPATSAATTSSTGASTTTSASAAPPTPTAPAGGGGTCARPSATSPPCATAGRPRRPARRSTTTTRRVEGLQLALRTRDGVPARRARRRRARRPRRARRRPLGAHPPGPAAGQRGRRPPARRARPLTSATRRPAWPRAAGYRRDGAAGPARAATATGQSRRRPLLNGVVSAILPVRRTGVDGRAHATAVPPDGRSRPTWATPTRSPMPGCPRSRPRRTSPRRPSNGRANCVGPRRSDGIRTIFGRHHPTIALRRGDALVLVFRRGGLGRRWAPCRPVHSLTTSPAPPIGVGLTSLAPRTGWVASPHRSGEPRHRPAALVPDGHAVFSQALSDGSAFAVVHVVNLGRCAVCLRPALPVPQRRCPCRAAQSRNHAGVRLAALIVAVTVVGFVVAAVQLADRRRSVRGRLIGRVVAAGGLLPTAVGGAGSICATSTCTAMSPDRRSCGAPTPAARGIAFRHPHIGGHLWGQTSPTPCSSKSPTDRTRLTRHTRCSIPRARCR